MIIFLLILIVLAILVVLFGVFWLIDKLQCWMVNEWWEVPTLLMLGATFFLVEIILCALFIALIKTGL